jgi:LCP family protein required for cell wall assembly
MSNRVARSFEGLLVLVVMASILFGATWLNGSPITLNAQSSQAQPEPDAAQPAALSQPAIAAPTLAPESALAATAEIAPTAIAVPGVVNTDTIATPVAFDTNFSPDALDANDAPLLQQAPGTINILLLGSDASPDGRWARTDSIIIASINPQAPSVSMLSLPRDLHVRIPGYGRDRINTAFERGIADNFPNGGGPGFLALVLRKNFGIQINHFVRIDFDGFVKAVDTLGGVEVLAECELHDTFPDPTDPTQRRGIDLDVYPGKVQLTGQQALWYSRSRWSTSDFDRARRQQKVLRAALKKAKDSDLLGNAVGLFGDLRSNIETDIGIGDVPTFVSIARNLDGLAIKSRVITFPIVKTLVRNDGAYVLDPQPGILSYISEALSPPVTNRAQTRVAVEVVNASSKPDMELIAAERLGWEGFTVIATEKIEDRFPRTQIIDYGTSPKGSPIARLANVFSVGRNDVLGQADPSSKAVARIVLGDDYNSCPNTASIAGDVTLGPTGRQVDTTPTPTP